MGIPDEDSFEGNEPVLPGWEHPIREFFGSPGTTAEYEYDLGDGRENEVALEAAAARRKGQKHPRCVEGARARPPEDCGGPTAARSFWP